MFTEEQIKGYLEVFENDDINLFNYSIKYGDYDKSVNDFISDCYEFDMIDKECFANLNEYLYNGTELHLVLETADISLIKSIMTYYIIGDNLCIGMLSKALDYKIFYIALNRLLEIKMEKGSLVEN